MFYGENTVFPLVEILILINISQKKKVSRIRFGINVGTYEVVIHRRLQIFTGFKKKLNHNF